jgi:hypothetical protein
MNSFKDFLNEAKMVRFIVMPKVIKGKLRPTDSIEVKASSAKEAREKAAKEFGFGIKPVELKAVAKYKDDAHYNEECGAGEEGTDALVKKYKKDTPMEETAANSVSAGGVDMNPTGIPKRDKRKKYDTESMYRRSLGLRAIEKIMKEKQKDK